MNDNAIDKFNLAKSIILASTSLRLFGCLFYKFNITLNDSNNPNFTAIAFATKNKKNNKLVFNISISKLFINSLKNANELVYVIIHEIMHILNKHGSRGATASSPELFNIAADHIINSALDIDIKNGSLKGLKSPESRIIITSLLTKNLTTEEVYSYLMDHATVSKIKYDIKIDGDDNNESSSQDGNQSSPQTSNQTSVEITKVHVKMDDGQEFEFYQDLSMSGEEIENEENNIQDDARRLLNSPIFESEKKKGNVSSRTMELVEEAIKVDIPWDQLLESVIKTNITERSENKSWYRVNKRMYPYNMILPYNDMEETYETLWVIIDTSGSITTYELKKAVYIIKSSMHHFKRVVKIDHDVQCYHQFKHVYDNSTIDNFQGDIKIKFTGRGGTSHKYVYDYIESVFENDIKNDPELQIPGLILFITDFESDIEQIHGHYKWPKEIPYKYMITSNRKFEVNPEVDKNPIWILNEK